MSLLSYTSKLNTDCIKKIIEVLKTKRIECNELALVLLASNAHAFTSLSPVAGSQVHGYSVGRKY
jgi:hypothetical protein